MTPISTTFRRCLTWAGLAQFTALTLAVGVLIAWQWVLS